MRLSLVQCVIYAAVRKHVVRVIVPPFIHVVAHARIPVAAETVVIDPFPLEQALLGKPFQWSDMIPFACLHGDQADGFFFIDRANFLPRAMRVSTGGIPPERGITLLSQT